MSNVNEQIGKKIRLLRNEKGLNQTEFGKMFNLSQNRVTNIETGKSELSFEELLAFADYFKVPTDYILKENGVKEDNPKLQFICDYIGLNDVVVEKLRKHCVYTGYYIYDDDKKIKIDECDEQLDRRIFEERKKRINDYIMSETFDEFVSQQDRVSYVNDMFLGFLALCCNDYDMFSKLYFADVTKDDISDCIIDFVYNYGNREIHNPFGNDIDLAIFRAQKSLLQYFNKSSFLDEVKDRDLQNQLDICLYFINTTLSRVKTEKLDAYECIEEITKQDTFPAVKNDKIRNLYEKLKDRKLEKS